MLLSLWLHTNQMKAGESEKKQGRQNALAVSQQQNSCALIIGLLLNTYTTKQKQ